jgi:hypothetical protein
MTHVAQPPVAGEGRATELDRVNHWISGGRVAGTSGRRGPVYNPATGQVAREVDFASVEEVDAAVAAAHEAFHGSPQARVAFGDPKALFQMVHVDLAHGRVDREGARF